jgi:hypothetical protein
MKTRLRLAVFILLAGIPGLSAQSMPAGLSLEAHQQQMKKEAELKRNGLAAMGFDQDAAVHHFRLRADGGAIEVEAAKATDEATREAIRVHLREIAAEFERGSFDKPFRTHGEAPPGVSELVGLRGAVTYRFEEMPAGGRVRITTVNPDALAALHAFLTYQIREHATGDSQVVEK